ncbi:DNA-binding transcriptional activator of the SARP family [Micromonospora matsumotoense]|uniref:DNA-binding transcriptional activator of the SARP family n=1 Tax=Micromonospora matsumotoense TaxID=121616 RepID=A0A1C4Z7X1_9ACTN|nr:BTAD domain-containing putative transcriptional regulator [Micromonospora matsumotoense]SCF28791.1 DNA-binding transcriptional activator of the SARP family [Micromonospora matsumotoense]
MIFRVLGPLALAQGQDSVVLPPSRVTTMLAALLVRSNEVVSVGALQEAIWGDEQPLAAKAALHTCAMRLRQLFVRHSIMASSIETVPGGYRFNASGQTVDLVRFREMASAAESEPQADRQLVLMEGALSLWRGPVLANVPSESLHRDAVPRLNEERLWVLERLCELKIRLGFAASAIVPLWEATRSNLGNERLTELLIEALYRTGRQPEALAEYRRVKDFLADELGVDPGPRLRQLELSILNGEGRTEPPPLAGARAVAAAPAGLVALPAIASPQGFVGRRALVDAVATRLRANAGVLVLTGLPGVGKTALARRVASLVQSDFPAGQLLIGMRDADGHPLRVAELAGQLERWPRADPTRRGLLILDDVADVQQALASAPLWTPGDAVLLTSQFGLGGVVARFGGWIERVSGLSAAEATALLGALIGAERVDAEPAAATALAELCGHLPLALRIAAARLLTRTTSLAESVTWLRENPIARLALPGDPDMALLGRLDTAVNRLEPPLVDAVLRLGAQELDPLDLSTVARRLQVAPHVAEVILDQLADASLLDEHAGKYRMLDLLRLYSRGAINGRRPIVDASTTLSASGTEF